MNIKGKFVEDCLWTPRVIYYGISDFSTFNPTPTMKTGSPFEYLMSSTGEISMWLHESKFTLSCSMDFTWYPMDNQVCSKEILSINFILCS